jgi:hypothetical protein
VDPQGFVRHALSVPLHQQLQACHRRRFRPNTEPGEIRLLDIQVQSGHRFEHGPIIGGRLKM